MAPQLLNNPNNLKLFTHGFSSPVHFHHPLYKGHLHIHEVILSANQLAAVQYKKTLKIHI